MSEMLKYQGLNATQMAMVQAEISGRRKSKGLAYLLLLLFAWCGAHRFYIGDIGMGILHLVLSILSYATLGVSFIIWAIIVFVELFILSGRVDAINNKIEEDVIARVRMMTPSTPATPASPVNEPDAVSASSVSEPTCGTASAASVSDDAGELPEL